MSLSSLSSAHHPRDLSEPEKLPLDASLDKDICRKGYLPKGKDICRLSWKAPPDFQWLSMLHQWQNSEFQKWKHLQKVGKEHDVRWKTLSKIYIGKATDAHMLFLLTWQITTRQRDAESLVVAVYYGLLCRSISRKPGRSKRTYNG